MNPATALFLATALPLATACAAPSAPQTDQAHGIASRNALHRLLDGQTVRIEVYGTDRYAAKSPASH